MALSETIAQEMNLLGKRAKQAARTLSAASPQAKRQALLALAKRFVRSNSPSLLQMLWMFRQPEKPLWMLLDWIGLR